ncbi:hypothetical protein BUALT_Bualt19G0084200 [Buddleja alternifolia]|uniref:Uncharacterized protein n=1 Tax=Buddleja alternifolia TaxID=168488 RepID=A0AAV6W204_9LAMI|nr:hypothetical protein BUALT_Bualt19G0084200 [Buddleja alternifolia]
MESPPPPSRPPPPPPYYTVHHHYEPVQPSAPPLPPWLEYDHQFQEMLLKSNEANSSSSASVDDSISRSPEINSPDIRCTEFQAETSSYQQYMVQDPVYDTTIVPELVKLEKNDGALGCVIGFGVHLVRCVFPLEDAADLVTKRKEEILQV